MSEDQKSVILTACSKEVLKNCIAMNPRRYPIKQAGNWADSLRQKRPVVYNDFSKSANQKGLPTMKITVKRLLSVPILEEDKVKSVFIVGNKLNPYDREDVLQLSLIAAEFSKIIKQRQTERDLRDSKEKYSSLFANMIDGFAYCKMIFDDQNKPVDFVYLEVNDAFEALTGLKKESVLGKKVTEAIPGIKEGNPELFEIYGRVASTRKNEKIELFFKPLSIWLSISVYSPRTGFFAAVFENITERKNIELALRKEETKFRTMADFTNDWEYWIAPDQSVVYMSPSVKKFTGLDADAFIKNPRLLSEIVHPDDRPLFESHYKLKPKEKSHAIDFRIVTCDGEIKWISHICQTVFDKDGGWLGRRVSNRDITERKKAEGALKTLNEELEERVQQRTAQVAAERQRLYNVLETLPSYVILLDRDYRVRFANKVFRETFGEDHGRRCHEYLFGKDHECEGCETYKVYKQNKPQHWYWTGPNGHDYDIYDFPFREADGALLILEMGIDITERKRAEAQALESARKLKDSERLAAIGATAGMVGHDIRNPLQAITSDVYLAKSELAALASSEEKKNALESLDEIEKNITYINKIVQDLQDYARPIRATPKEINLETVIEQTLKNNHLPRDIRIKVKVESAAEQVIADPDLLRRIIGNLVTNAVQAMPEGGKITIRSFKDGSDTVISVQDTGTGIAEDVKPRLFTPLFTTKSKGQGFGLSAVKRIVETMNGTVTFESEIGKGTKFIVRLPDRK